MAHTWLPARRRRLAWLVLALTQLTQSARADALSVSVRAAMWTLQGDTRGFGYQALLNLTLGFEELLLRRAPPLAEPSWEPDETLAQTPEAEDEELDEEAPASSAEQAPATTPAATTPTATEDAGDDVARTLESRPFWLSATFARELIAAVERHFAGSERDAELLSLGSRSRTAALLPVLRLRAGRGTDQTLRLSPTLDDPDRWLQSGGADFRYEAQATWTLDRLVFTNDEITLERLRLQLDRTRRERLKEALLHLFRWQAARLRSRDPALDPEANLEAQIDELQAEIQLDALSGGWFVQRLRGRDAL